MIRSRGVWKKRSGPTSPRMGFTLLELLLTAILAATLILTLWSLFGTYLRIFETGRTRAEQAQLARAVVQRMTDDLRSIALVPKASSTSLLPVGANSSDGSSQNTFGPTASSTNSSTGSASSNDSFSLGFDSAGGGSAAGIENDSTRLPQFSFVGNDRRLEIQIIQSVVEPEDDGDGELELNAERIRNPLASELKTVVYTFEPERAPNPTDRLPPPGLVRRAYAWDMTSLHSDEANNQSGQTSEDSQLSEMTPDEIAEEEKESEDMFWVREMIGLRLRYFDGQDWLAEWNSNESGSLPRAVEIVFQLDKLEDVLSRQRDEARLEGVIEDEEEDDDELIGEERDGMETLLPEGSFRQVVFLPFAAQQQSTLYGGDQPAASENALQSLGGSSP